MSSDKRIPGFAYRAGRTDAAPLRLTPLPEVYVKSFDTKKLSVTSVLTYPVEDRAGDVVNPDGGDWREHKARPWVGLEHLRWHATEPNTAGLMGQRGITTRPVVVAWARESLSQPGAPHAVALKAIELDGRTHHLPVGTSYFDPSDELSAQTFRLIEEDALPGVSLEFRPDPVHKSVRHARSPLERRPSYDFDKWGALAWVHCAVPVNPGATVCKSVLAATDKLAGVLGAGRIGSEPLHPVLFKALSRYLPEPTRTTVRIEAKAMNPDEQTPETAYDAADTDGDGTVDSQDAPADGGKPLNGVEAFYSKVQRLMDSNAELLSDMEASDSPELRAAAKKVCDKVCKIAEWAKGVADKHDAKLSGKAPEADAGEEEDDADETEPEEGDDDADMETDDDKTLKAVRPCYRPKLLAVHKAMLAARVVRVTKAQVAAAPTVETAPAPVEPNAEPSDSPEDIAALERAIKLHQRALKRYGA